MCLISATLLFPTPTSRSLSAEPGFFSGGVGDAMANVDSVSRFANPRAVVKKGEDRITRMRGTFFNGLRYAFRYAEPLTPGPLATPYFPPHFSPRC